jgi:hypothetical protein
MRQTILLPTVLLLAAVAGCGTSYSYSPLAVLARDAETLEPVPFVDVRASYVGWPKGPLYPPKPDTGLTDRRGMATLNASADTGGPIVRLRSDDYDHATAPARLVDQWCRRVESGTNRGDPHEPDVVVDMWANPRPLIEVVLPDGFRGIVQLGIPEPAPPPVPRRRHFRVEVPAHGVVELPPAPVLREYDIRAFYHVRFADGRTVYPASPRHLDPSDPAPYAWRQAKVDEYRVFFIGTVAEHELASEELLPKWRGDIDEWNRDMQRFQEKVRAMRP